tara:strand:+ start:664 stop:933 length:270 start_codon:yes stop_codon:yes gene_type:complete
MIECPKELVCFTEEEWVEFIMEYELEIIDEANMTAVEPASDAQAVADFTWQILFLSPWELAYIALPMTVLAFYGLTIYGIFKYIQRRFS